MKKNSERAGDAVGCLIAHGIEDVVICAGARNAPLIVPILEQECFTVWRHFDERSAAFFALGLAKRKGKAVAVVTTSGTAVAELLPATIEAFYSGIPLFLLTADRPERFRGSGAPQAIDQEKLFGEYAEYCDDPAETLDWDQRVPLHLNLCLEEPEPILGGSISPTRYSLPEKSESSQTVRLPQFPKNTVAIVGELPAFLRNEVLDFLRKLNVPTWCDGSSGIRESAGLNLVLDESIFQSMDIEAVVRFGGVPSLRFWRDLETREEVMVHNLTHTAWSGLARESTTSTIQEGTVFDSTGLSDHSGSRTPESFVSPPTTPEETAIRKFSEIIPEEALVFLGNSLPIREWNRAATIETPHPNCFANRGANGIDGELSTFFGLSRGEQESWAILGDLTTLYDLNAPWVLDQLGEGKRRIVVINNGGGKIFSKLPSMKGFSEEQKFVSENHHQLRFEHWAAMWQMEYLKWDGSGDFPQPKEQMSVIELKVEGK